MQNAGTVIEKGAQQLARDAGNAVEWLGDRTGLSKLRLPRL